MANNSEQMNSIEKIINDLKYIRSFAEEYHQLFEQLHIWQNEQVKCDNYLKYKKRYHIWGIILSILLPIVYILSIFGIKYYAVCWDLLDSILFMMSVLALCFAIPLTPFTVYLVLRGTILSNKKKLYREKAISNIDYYREQIDHYKYDQQYASQRDLYIQYFPDCNADGEDVDHLIFVLETKRASSFQEALHLLDEKKHNKEMLAIAKQTMEYAKRAAEKPTSSTTTIYK